MADLVLKNERAWPTRRSICLDCRTVTTAAESCHACGSLRVRSLVDPVERDLIVTEVWGPPSLRRRTKQLSKAGAAGGTVGGALEVISEGCGGLALDLETLAFIFAVLFFTGAFVLGRWTIGKLVAVVRQRRNRLLPKGALRRPARLGAASGATGTVDTKSQPPRSPLSGERAVAFGVVCTSKTGMWTREVTLRDAATIGFDVHLDSGETMRIPEGPVLLDMRSGHLVDVEASAVTSYLEDIDPTRDSDAEHDPLPHQQFTEALVRPGDRVEVLGPLERIADGAGAEAGYRDPGPSVLTPRGIPRVRILR